MLITGQACTVQDRNPGGKVVFETRYFVSCFAAVALVTTLLASVADAQVLLPRSATYDEFIKIALAVTPDSESVRPQIKQVLEDTFVLFIPGALGSKLYSESGDPIWGQEAMPKLDSLKLSPTAPPARVKVLDTYPLGVARSDVYGKFDTLISAAIGGIAQRQEFAYDWREDIDVIANRLEDSLRGDLAERLRGKKLIIVAHSMGGVVAWHWKNKHLRKGGYEFTDVSKLILLGSPLQGSCEMLRMLLKGYRPIPGAGFLENKLYNFLFQDLKPAAYTFPGVFQLLPADDHLDSQTSCLVIKTQAGRYPLRHFDIDIWDKHLFKFLEDVWTKLDLDRSEFRRQLARILLKAREFRHNLHRDLSETPLSNKVEYFYSNEHETTSQVFITEKEKLDVESGIIRDGDGRVMKASATNRGYYTMIPREARSTHGDLVKDSSFVDFIDLYLKRNIQVRRMRAIAEILSADIGAKRSFAKSGLILSLSGLGARPLAFDQLNPEMKTILALNVATIEALNARPENARFQKSEIFLAAYEYGRYLDGEGKKRDALPLYETALASGVLEGTPNEAYALNRYSYALLSQGRYEEALPAAYAAKVLVERSPGMYPAAFQGKVLNNFGVTTWKAVGDFNLSVKAFKEALRLGSEKAQLNEGLVRGELRSRHSM